MQESDGKIQSARTEAQNLGIISNSNIEYLKEKSLIQKLCIHIFEPYDAVQ